jgi:hypothetical protein
VHSQTLLNIHTSKQTCIQAHSKIDVAHCVSLNIITSKYFVTQQLCINTIKIKITVPQTLICKNHVHSILAKAINWTPAKTWKLKHIQLDLTMGAKTHNQLELKTMGAKT